MSGPKYEWACNRLECKYFVTAYTEGGIRALTEEHLSQHRREDADRVRQSLQAEAIVLFRRPKNYDILTLTERDIGFLRTRHIKIDKDIEYDPTIEPRPTTAQMHQREWARILEAAWNR